MRYLMLLAAVALSGCETPQGFMQGGQWPNTPQPSLEQTTNQRLQQAGVDTSQSSQHVDAACMQRCQDIGSGNQFCRSRCSY